MKLLIEFLQKPFRVKWMLLQAICYSLYYKRLIQKCPFEKYAEKMGTFKYETPRDPVDDPLVEEVKWVAYAVKRWTPWKSLCFDQALLSKRLLNKRGIPCTLYMGLCRNMEGELAAHAWLRCGNVYVSGGNGVAFTITGVYGDKEPMNTEK